MCYMGGWQVDTQRTIALNDAVQMYCNHDRVEAMTLSYISKNISDFNDAFVKHVCISIHQLFFF